MSETSPASETSDQGSAASHCSVAVEVPSIPNEAIEFAESVAALAEKAGLCRVEMDIEVNTGIQSKYWCDHELRCKTQTKMKVFFSNKDGRGRPYKRLSIEVDNKTTVPIQWDQESSS